MRTIKHTPWYFSGNIDHSDKKLVYVTDSREMLKLLMTHKIHVFTRNQQCEFLGEATEAGHARLKVIADSKKLYASNLGLYRLA
jgi:hypothetical protein